MVLSGSGYSLAVLDERGLATGAVDEFVGLLNVSALQPEGLRDPFQKFRASGCVFLWPSWMIEDSQLALALEFGSIPSGNLAARRAQISLPEASGK